VTPRYPAVSFAASRFSAWLLMASLFATGPVATLAPLGMGPLFLSTAVMLGGLHWLSGRRASDTREPLVVLLTLLGLYAALSLAWTPALPEAGVTLAVIAGLFLPGFLLFGGVAALPETSRPGLENAFLAGLGLGTAILVVEAGWQSPILHLMGGALEPAGIEPVGVLPPLQTCSLAVYALMVWPAALILERRGYLLLAAAVPVAMAGITIWASSGNAGPALVVGLGIFSLSWRSVTVARRLIAAVLVVCFVAVVPIVQGLDALELQNADWLPAVWREHIDLWRQAAERVLDQPLFGQGLEATTSSPLATRPLEESLLGSSAPQAGNFFLRVWVEFGAIGAALALALALAALGILRTLPSAQQRYALAGYATLWMMLGAAGDAWQPWWLASVLTATTALILTGRLVPLAWVLSLKR